MPKKIAILFMLILPFAVWVLYRPVRVLAPTLNGVTCVSDSLCVEDLETVDRARALYDAALAFVNAEVGQIEKRPRAIFCATEQCNRSFGFDGPAKAYAIGVSGIVLSPRGWHDYLLRHEMIHHLQAERLGVIGQWLSPDWFKEGMAYSLSDDPRSDLAGELQQYRTQFEAWFGAVGKARLWDEARKL